MLLEFKDITYQYPGSSNDVFKNLTCKISSPGFHALFGPSGVGKTTLAKMLTGSVKGFSGEISTSGIHHILWLDIAYWYCLLLNVIFIVLFFINQRIITERKPLVQIIKHGEQIPFDVAGTRTIPVDHRDLENVEDIKYWTKK